MKKLLLFGAGRIGRSFIGQLFSQGGYEVVFVDINPKLIDELNKRGWYNVIIREEADSVIEVKNVRGLYASDIGDVESEIAGTDILAVSVGLSGLRGIMPVIAAGLILRRSLRGDLPLDIIIAENLRNAARYFENELRRLLPADYPLRDLVGLVETSIGKMVPFIQQKDIDEDPLAVVAEKYNTLILDGKAFKNPIPDIDGLAPKEKMQAWVDRKLFIHNLGHAALAYYAHYVDKNLVFTWQALEIPDIFLFTRQTMLQAADILVALWPAEFSVKSLTEHIEDLLKRFANKALADTIYRVGCDLQRKMGPDDRIAGAIRAAQKVNRPYGLILRVLVYASHFRAVDETGRNMTGDIEFAKIHERGINTVMTTICGFDEKSDSEIISLAESLEKRIYS